MYCTWLFLQKIYLGLLFGEIVMSLEITEEDFEAYVRCQMSGVTNMFHADNVSAITGLTRIQIIKIMCSYSELLEKYPKVKVIRDNRGR